jgi:HAMP domain-containing protein
MECRDVRDMADSFLSGELVAEASREILRHLSTCPMCRVNLDARQSLRDGVRRAFHGARDLQPAPEFVSRLRATLSQVDRQPRAHRGLRLPESWMLAAAALLAVASALAYRGVVNSGAVARLAVGDHRNCALERRLAEKSIPLEEAALRYGDATYRIFEKLPSDEIGTPAGSARIVRRHACVYEGRRFAHVILEYRGALVSLLVTNDDRGAPFALRGDALPRVTAPTQIDHTPVVSFRTGRYVVFFAGDVAPADLTLLADAIAAPLYRELAGA